MAVKKLEIIEVLQLNEELSNLIKEVELSFVLKYDLVKLYEKTKVIVKRFSKSRDDIIKQYGVCVDKNTDSYTLEGAKDRVKADKEIDALAEIKESFNEEFLFNDFEALKSGKPYVQIMKFLKK
jgi:hypothetical protein